MTIPRPAQPDQAQGRMRSRRNRHIRARPRGEPSLAIGYQIDLFRVPQIREPAWPQAVRDSGPRMSNSQISTLPCKAACWHAVLS